MRIVDMRLFPLLSIALVAAACGAPGQAEKAVRIPAPAIDVPAAKGLATAVFAGGCFWGVEAVFERAKGVRSVTSGYAGGTAQTANYDMVSSEQTDHAEAVRIVYDPAVISYGKLLQIYFSAAHDPTQLNRQGPDVGKSYRSAIFPQSADQTKVARAYMAQLMAAKKYPRPIVTRIESGKFYAAEAYHQDFMRKNPSHPYILRWDVPKVAAAKAAFPGIVG
jgi:peptide-methionine (S)-S-oxide reductase